MIFLEGEFTTDLYQRRVWPRDSCCHTQDTKLYICIPLLINIITTEITNEDSETKNITGKKQPDLFSCDVNETINHKIPKIVEAVADAVIHTKIAR